jgi:predicted nucleic acid-binding protein
MAKTVLLDSGFLIRLMNPNEPLHRVALDLFKDYVSSGVTCMVSTVALAEYGVKGELRYLPTKYLQFLPFQYHHAEVAAMFMRRIIQVKQERGAEIKPRVIIPNDTKMFAQASAETDIFAFVSADAEAKKVYELLEDPGFEFVNIRT